MKKVAMIGVGKLGQDCAEVMAIHHHVYGYDLEERKPSNFEMKQSIRDAVIDRDIIFIAAPTPHDPKYGGETPTSHLPNKDFDYTIVTDILKEVDKHSHSGQLVVLISTVLPGTTRSQLRECIKTARFVYNPYLIAMGTIKWDMTNPEMVIIGTEDGSITGDAQELIDFYKPLMQNNPRYVVGTWDEAEAIKIFYNTFISTKLALVNMVQDVAEVNGNMNVDVVTKALADSTYRIMGPAYMKAGLGDAGACHPRDNIALRWLADNLDLGYDLFDSIMTAREVQAERMALRCLKNGKNVVIVGKAYKPKVHYTNGSASMLVGYYIEKHGGHVHYYDLHTGDTDLKEYWADVYLIGYWDDYVERIDFPPHTTVIDPWRRCDIKNHTGDIIHYGDTRPKAKNYRITKEAARGHIEQVFTIYPELLEYEDKIHLTYAGIHFDFTFQLRSFEDIVSEIEDAIKDGKTKFLFDGHPEDFQPFILKKIHRVARHFSDRIPSTNFFYLCGADNVQDDYDALCRLQGYEEKVTILNSRYFEWCTKPRVNHSRDSLEYRIAPRQKRFLCFNKLPRQHRVMLLERLLERQLLDKGFYSFIGDEEFYTKMIPFYQNSNEYPNVLKNIDMLPIRLNATPERLNPVDINEGDLAYFDNSMFSVVTETTYFYVPKMQSSVFLTEKTFKPIALGHPFIIAARPNTLATLKKYGYKTFSPYIDESYDNIEDDNARMDAIANEVKRLCELSEEEALDWQRNVKDIVEYNKNLYFTNQNYRLSDNICDLFNDGHDYEVNVTKFNYLYHDDRDLEPLPDPVTYSGDPSVYLVPIRRMVGSQLDKGVVTLDSKIVVEYPRALDGGGLDFKNDLIEIIKKSGTHSYKRAFEWCAGFGVLGFEMLGLGYCNHIVFSDYYPKAIENCLKTAKDNNLENYVTGYVTPTIAGLPENEVFDLIVSNPPHSASWEEFVETTENDPDAKPETYLNSARLVVDKDWTIHREFFLNIRKHLTATADIYLIENGDHEILKTMAKMGGLYHVNSYTMEDKKMRRGTVMHFKVLHDFKKS